MNPFLTGKIIAEKRKALGLNQIQLAQMLNVSNRTVSKWENGDGYPDITLLPDISKALGVSVDYLLTGEETEQSVVVDINANKPIYSAKGLYNIFYIASICFGAFSALLGGVTELYCIWAFPILFYTHWEIMFVAVSLFTTVLSIMLFVFGIIRLSTELDKSQIIKAVRKRALALFGVCAVFPLTFVARLVEHSRWGNYTAVIMAVIIIALIAVTAKIYKRL